jgi:hypothetical protein
MVSLPTVAIAVAEVGIGIDGVDIDGAGGVDGVDTGGASSSLDVLGSAGGGIEAGADVGSAVAGLLVSRTGAVVGRALAGSYVEVYAAAEVVGNSPTTGGTAPGGSKVP